MASWVTRSHFPVKGGYCLRKPVVSTIVKVVIMAQELAQSAHDLLAGLVGDLHSFPCLMYTMGTHRR